MTTVWTVVDEKSVMVDVFVTEAEAKACCLLLKRGVAIYQLLSLKGVVASARGSPPGFLLEALAITQDAIDTAAGLLTCHSVVEKTLA